MRNFDLQQQFAAISKSATEAIKEIFPIEGKLRTIRLTGVTVDNSTDSTDYAAQSKLKIKEGTWGAPVYASLELVDNATGKVIDKTTKVKLFTLPKPTDRFSYIVGGNEYQVHSQLRLKPGVYTLRKQNGELKTQINLAKGKNFDLGFDDRSGTFTIQKVGGGQANIPLYPVLLHLGVSPSSIGKSWGTKLEQANRDTDPKSVSRAESAFGVKKGSLRDYFAGTQIGAETTKLVLGESFDKVDGALLLASSKHLLDVHMGEKEPVDRDALTFKELHSVEDYLHERIQKNKQTLAFKLKRNIDNIKRTKLSQIVNPGAFSSVIESFFTQDDKSATPEQTNPIEMLSGQFKTTIMGSGGIKQEHAITPEMRDIHSSHYGFLDPVATPESKRIGANLSVPIGAVKDGKELKVAVVDKSGKITHLSALEAYGKYVAFPAQKGDQVRAMYQGKIVEVPRSKVDYTTPSASYLFSWSTNLIPYLASNQGNRAMMASKQIEQAISLKHREAPLVQVGATSNRSMENLLGDKMVVKAPADGTVKSITPDFMILKTATGDVKLNLYNNFSLNRKSFLHHNVRVKEGEKVKAGQLLADTNFTKDGELAIGTNMRVAYLPYKGLNFEDGIVISQSAAEKLTSEHIHKKTLDFNETSILGVRVFTAYYPNSVSPNNLKKLSADGVIKKGEKIRQGEAVMVALQKRAPSSKLTLVHKALSDRPKDISLYWTLEDEGTVIDVQKTSSSITVFIKTEEPAKIGDKLAGRMGNKGIITKILPDHEVPHDAEGKPVDVLLNPHGVISRINIGQIYESAAGKVALKKGAPHLVQNFSGENYLRTTRELLKQNGTKDKEELFDPSSGKSLGKVHVGHPYILKLFKQGTVNYSVRQGGAGVPYDANFQPLKVGGEVGSKTMDLLTVYSMLSHGAKANLQEMVAIKSNQNDEFWRAIKYGQQLPPPKTPFVYDKFLNYLKAAGIDVKKDGSKLTLAPLTDKQVQHISNGEIKKSQLYRAKDMKAVPGGFFDPTITGGFSGSKWSHIELQEAVVNPVFEKAVRKLTDLGTKFDQVMSGALHLAADGTFNTEGKGVTGGKAIEKILKKIDVSKELEALKTKALRAKADKLDDINKRMRYLQALKDNKLRPEEAYLRKFVPIIPPAYRPVYPLPDGNVTASDVNYLYHNTGILNDMHKLPVMSLLAEEEKSDIRKDLYQNVKGISGLADLNIRGRERNGFISEIKGGSGGQPKEGFFISKLLSKKQDFVGRGTIIPEPDLGIDEMAMPEEMAWKIFEPFIVRELKNRDKTPLQAKDEIKAKTPLAKKALEIVMSQRHVLLNRAPSLHKFSIMAFKPTLTTGRAIKIPPLVVKGFNADFDGDNMLGLVWTLVDETGIRALEKTFTKAFIEARNMTARFKTQIPTLTEKGEVLLFNLEDFPHGELLGSKEGEKGRIDFYKALPGFYALSHDHQTNSLAWKSIYGWSKHYQREIEVVTLSSGYQIVTDDDPRAVYGAAAGTLEMRRFTPSEALEKRVFVPRAVGIESAKSSVPTTKRTFSSGELSVPLSKDFGYFVGAMVANGWVEHHLEKPTGKLVCAVSNEGASAGYKDAINAVFDKQTYSVDRGAATAESNHYGASTKVYFSHMPLARLMVELIGLGAHNKHLPPNFLVAPQEFKKGLLAGLMDNDGSISVTNKESRANGQLTSAYTSVSIRLIQEVQLLASSLGIRSRITVSKTPAGKPFWCLSFSSPDIKKWGGEGMHHTEKLAALEGAVVNDAAPSSAKSDIVPVPKHIAEGLRKIMGAPREASKEQKSLYTILSKAITTGSMSRITARSVFNFIDYARASKELKDLASWTAVIENREITWDVVESLEKTGIFEDGYDLTVPGYETFMNVDGVILSNTMTVHVPITEEANREAAKMLPSANLFQPGTGKLMIAPSQEAQIGMFYLSKTPAGLKTLNGIVPAKYAIKTTLDKKETARLLAAMAKELPNQQFATVVAALKKAGEGHAYDRGFTLGLDDLPDVSKARDMVVAEARIAANKTKNEDLLSKINVKATDLIDRILSKSMKGKNNPLYDMVESGARGDKSQLRSIMATPLFVSDSKNRIVATPIKKSYAEGLDVGDYWTSMYGARRGMMDRAIQTSEPGAFSKNIMATTIDNVISAKDCGTKNGIAIKLDNQDALHRFLAGAQGGLGHNTLVDSQVLTRLKKAGLNLVKVRSPLTCHRPKGTCSYCYGLDEHNKMPDVGDNVGAKAGQTLSEPLTQLIMNSFHTGGVAGTGTSVGGYQRINQLLSVQKDIKGASPLAPVAGKVTKIEPGIAGGFKVHIGDASVYVSKGSPLKVAVGSKVSAGDALAEGSIKPQDLVKHKGMLPAQEYIVDELQKAYSAQGVGIQKRIFETVVRSLANTTKVLNNPRDTGHLPGDVISYTVAQAHNRDLELTKPVEEAVGYKLAESYGGLRKGHELTIKDVKTIKGSGIIEVKVQKDAIVHAPFLKGISTLPLLKRNWMSALSYRNLSKAITEGASQGWTTDTSDYHPVPALANATTFGKGKEGKY